MDNRKTIFCEMAFLEKFKESRPYSMFPTEESIREEQIWNNLNLALFNSNVWLDCDDQKLQKRTEEDEYMKYLWKRSTDGYSDVQCGGEDFPNIGTDQLDYQDGDEVIFSNALYLTDKDYSECACFWGTLNLSLSNYLQHGELYKDNGASIRRGETIDWSLLKDRANHNLNSMIIVDNYVLKDNYYHNRVKNNLIAVLDNLLPHKLGMPFVLTIFSLSKNLEKDREYVLNEIRSIRPGLKDIEVEVFNSEIPGQPKFFHDRAIISNNILIGVGGGFDLFRKDKRGQHADKTTNISIVYPYLQKGVIDWADGTYMNIIKDANKCLLATDCTSKNYLLKTVKSSD